jgi:hypothetical protein
MNGWQVCARGDYWSVGFAGRGRSWVEVYSAPSLMDARRVCVLLLMYGGFPWEKDVSDWVRFAEQL